MRTLALATTLTALLALGTVSASADPASPMNGRIEDRSRICMMQDSLQPKPGVAHQYAGKTYWLCCEMCVRAFTADPEHYAHAKDPVNGAVVDKATAPAYAFNGKAFFFSSEKTLAVFAKEPARYLHGG
jgi:YHS domain-containing protein